MFCSGRRADGHSPDLLDDDTLRWLTRAIFDEQSARRSVHEPNPTAIALPDWLELSAFLELAAPSGGHDPGMLTAGHMHKFVADQRQRELDGLTSLGARGVHGKPSIVTANTRQAVFNRTRRLLRGALESGEADRLGLDRGFIAAMPAPGRVVQRTRAPFTDGGVQIGALLVAGRGVARFDPVAGVPHPTAMLGGCP